MKSKLNHKMLFKFVYNFNNKLILQVLNKINKKTQKRLNKLLLKIQQRSAKLMRQRKIQKFKI